MTRVGFRPIAFSKFAIDPHLADKILMRAAVLVMPVLLLGCGPRGRGLADDDLAFKAPAIKQAVDDDQLAAVPKLVKDLDDEDSAVRFYAIEGLRRLTGRTFDYHYYDDPTARQPAIERWQDWMKGQGMKEPRP